MYALYGRLGALMGAPMATDDIRLLVTDEVGGDKKMLSGTISGWHSPLSIHAIRLKCKEKKVLF